MIKTKKKYNSIRKKYKPKNKYSRKKKYSKRKKYSRNKYKKNTLRKRNQKGGLEPQDLNDGDKVVYRDEKKDIFIVATYKKNAVIEGTTGEFLFECLGKYGTYDKKFTSEQVKKMDKVIEVQFKTDSETLGFDMKKIKGRKGAYVFQIREKEYQNNNKDIVNKQIIIVNDKYIKNETNLRMITDIIESEKTKTSSGILRIYFSADNVGKSLSAKSRAESAPAAGPAAESAPAAEEEPAPTEPALAAALAAEAEPEEKSKRSKTKRSKLKKQKIDKLMEIRKGISILDGIEIDEKKLREEYSRFRSPVEMFDTYIIHYGAELEEKTKSKINELIEIMKRISILDRNDIDEGVLREKYNKFTTTELYSELVKYGRILEELKAAAAEEAAVAAAAAEEAAVPEETKTPITSDQSRVTDKSNTPVEELSAIQKYYRTLNKLESEYVAATSKKANFQPETEPAPVPTPEEQKKLDINSLNDVAQEITRNINKEVDEQIETPQDFEKQLLLYKNANEICDVLLSFGCQLPPEANRSLFRDRIKEIEDALKTKRETR